MTTARETDRFLYTGRSISVLTGMNGAEDMIVDHDMVVTQIFGRRANALTAPVSPPSSICG